jgi:serine/threonine-protein kinase
MISVELWRSPNRYEVAQIWTFHYQPVIKIGRALDNDIVLPFACVSRYHLELRLTPVGWTLMNLSINKTLMRQVPVHSLFLEEVSEIQLAVNGPKLTLRLHPKCEHLDNPVDTTFCQNCGIPLKILKTIQDYQVVKILGQGGMGTTYQVWKDGELLVLKEMNADLAHNPKAQELFEREAYTLRRLRHPGIPRFYKYFWQEGRKYLLMEMLHGEDLEHYVYKHGPIPVAQAVAYMIQLCDILQYIHTQDPPIIHRDIKPANIFWRYRDQGIMLLDFGAVKEIGTTYGTLIGAPTYCAPEQGRGRPVLQSDLYAIAPTLLFMITGKDPSNFQENRGDGVRFYADKIAQIPHSLAKLIATISAPHFGDRPRSAAQIQNLLTECIQKMTGQ